MWKYTALCLVLWTGTQTWAAPSAQEVRALQYALNRIDRYPSGPVDGIIGPRTRAAVAAFAGSRPLEAAFWPVAAQVTDLVWWQGPWTEEAEIAVQAALAKASKSKRTPILRERRLWRGRGAQAACARIHSRDGDWWLYFPLRTDWHRPDPMATPVARLTAGPPAPISRETSAVWCSLGYVQEGGSPMSQKPTP